MARLVRLWPVALLGGLTLSGCTVDFYEEQPRGYPWRLSDPLVAADMATSGGDMGAPSEDMSAGALAGYWDGPGYVGDCVDTASWLRFEEGGVFEYGLIDANACEPSSFGVSLCEGGWRLEAYQDRAGELAYWCEAPEPEINAPVARSSEGTFALIEHEDGWRELTPFAWSWSEGGALERRRAELVEYPASSELPMAPNERSSSELTTRVVLSREDGSAIESPEDLPALSPQLEEDLLLVVIIEAEAFFSLSGVREQGVERFELPATLRAEEGRYVLEAALPGGGTDYTAWSDFLSDEGIYARYPTAAGTFAVAFRPLLRMDPSRPRVWWSPGPWVAIEDFCGAYGARFGDLLERCAR